MTEQRSNAIADALTADQETMQRMLEMSAEDAVAEFDRMGYDFTVEELNEFHDELVEAAKHVKADGELDEEALANVSGGCSKCFAAGAAVGVIMLVTGVW